MNRGDRLKEIEYSCKTTEFEISTLRDNAKTEFKHCFSDIKRINDDISVLFNKWREHRKFMKDESGDLFWTVCDINTGVNSLKRLMCRLSK